MGDASVSPDQYKSYVTKRGLRKSIPVQKCCWSPNSITRTVVWILTFYLRHNFGIESTRIFSTFLKTPLFPSPLFVKICFVSPTQSHRKGHIIRSRGLNYSTFCRKRCRRYYVRGSNRDVSNKKLIAFYWSFTRSSRESSILL
jgi:hypothetical protein